MRRCIPLLALALTASACGGRSADESRRAKPVPDAAPPPTAVLGRVSVDDATPADRRPVAIPEAELEAMVRAAFAEAGVASAPAGEAPKAWRIGVEARVVYGVTRGEGIAAEPVPGWVKAVWRAELRLRPPGSREGMYVYADGADEAAFDGQAAGLPAALRARLKAALVPIARTARTRTDIVAKDVPELIAQLDHPDPEVRRATAGRLGMLRARKAVPALAARIRKEADRAVVLRMIGALAEIGDDGAADALIALADPRDREMLRAIVDALSTVGGERVDDFLDILGTHDSPDIRQMVEDARRRLGGVPAGAAASRGEKGAPE